MRERSVLQVGDDLLDDRVAAVVGLGLASIVRGESVNTAWWRQAGNSSPCSFGMTWSGLASRTRRTISRAVTACLLPREANAVKRISATSASLTHCRSCSSKTARG